MNNRGGTYLYILVVMMTLFLLAFASLGITAAGRQTSGHYMHHARLYGLAVSGNEHALILLQGGIHRNSFSYQMFFENESYTVETTLQNATDPQGGYVVRTVVRKTVGTRSITPTEVRGFIRRDASGAWFMERSQLITN